MEFASSAMPLAVFRAATSFNPTASGGLVGIPRDEAGRECVDRVRREAVPVDIDVVAIARVADAFPCSLLAAECCETLAAVAHRRALRNRHACCV